MRPPFFVIGLVFVATVLIPDVDAISCYDGLGNGEGGRVKVWCGPVVTHCYKYDREMDGEHWIARGCAGIEICDKDGMHCCSSDYCNYN